MNTPTLWAIAGSAFVLISFAVALRKSGSPVSKGLALVLAWIGLASALGMSGALQDFSSFPPKFFPFFLAILAFAFYLAFGRIGTQLVHGIGLEWLIAFHVFRVFAEMMIHSAAELGIAPPQMSFEGWNFDIVTAISAPVVAWAVRTYPARASTLALIWNCMGLGLLLNIVTVGVLSFPVPFRLFMNEPANTWITEFPYILLPAVMVLAALVGHILVFRKISSGSPDKLGRIAS